MPRVTNPLNDTQVKNAKAKDKDYSLFDGRGLEIRIKSSGTKIWLFRYAKPDDKTKRTRIQFGEYPVIGLADARAKRQEAEALLERGIDPFEKRKADEHQKRLESSSTLEVVAKDWLTEKKKVKKISEDHATDIWRSLEINVFPQLGDTPISEIGPKMLRLALKPIEESGRLETLRRVCSRINEIMKYARSEELITTNPAEDIGTRFVKPAKQHMPSLKPERLPEFLAALSNAQIRLETRCLIQWQLLTMVRPNEAVSARWCDISIDVPESDARPSIGMKWVIPAEFMKMKREHEVPLSPEALAILEVMRSISGHREYVFPSTKDPRKPMHAQTANAAIIRMGFGGELVAHGLRSIARTAIEDIGLFDPIVVESCLAHGKKNEVEAAYNRSNYLVRRRPVMDWWGNYVTEAAKGVLLKGRLRAVNE